MRFWPFGKKEKQSKAAGRYRAFNGAQLNRLTADFMSMTASIDADLRGALVRLRNRSRDLAQNYDFAKSAIREIQNNVIGRGVGFQSLVKMKRGDALNDKMNSAIEEAFDEWRKKQNCDVSGKLRFQDIERLIIRSIVENGESIIRLVFQPMGSMKTPLALQVIEPDLLDESYSGFSENGNRIKMGVELNQWDRPVAYHFRQKHPGDYMSTALESMVGQRTRLPANEIIHIFITERAGQTRGIPWLASTLLRAHNMQGYEEAEVVSARAFASQMGFIESPEGELQGDDVVDGDRVTDSEPGVWKYLGPGEKAVIPQVQRPNSQMDSFMRLMLRGMAAGIGASYESISKDYSQSNYSSSRLSLLNERDFWRIIQDWIIGNFHQTVFERFLDLAVLAGDIQISDYFANPRPYVLPRWLPRGWAWVDPLKDVTAYKIGVRCGFVTQTDVIAQNGGDIEDVMRTRARERKLAKSLDLVFDTDPDSVDDKGAAQTTDPDESEDSSGDNGAGSKTATLGADKKN